MVADSPSATSIVLDVIVARERITLDDPEKCYGINVTHLVRLTDF